MTQPGVGQGAHSGVKNGGMNKSAPLIGAGGGIKPRGSQQVGVKSEQESRTQIDSKPPQAVSDPRVSHCLHRLLRHTFLQRKQPSIKLAPLFPQRFPANNPELFNLTLIRLLIT